MAAPARDVVSLAPQPRDVGPLLPQPNIPLICQSLTDMAQSFNDIAREIPRFQNLPVLPVVHQQVQQQQQRLQQMQQEQQRQLGQQLQLENQQQLSEQQLQRQQQEFEKLQLQQQEGFAAIHVRLDHVEARYEYRYSSSTANCACSRHVSLDRLSVPR